MSKSARQGARPFRDRAYLEHTLQRLLDAAESLVWELDELDGDADLEPVNGSSSAADQRRWAAGASDDREEVCEDEGAQCEDEGSYSDDEPGAPPFVPDYHPDDQRQTITGRFGDHVFYTPA